MSCDLKRFINGQHEHHFELPKQQFCWPSDGVNFNDPEAVQSAENRRQERNQFWLPLRHALILISSVRTSASKKINLMALIRTLTILITAFERMKKNSMVFGRLCGVRVYWLCAGYLSGIFFRERGATSIVMQISFVMLNFELLSDQFFFGGREAKASEGGKIL